MYPEYIGDRMSTMKNSMSGRPTPRASEFARQYDKQKKAQSVAQLLAFFFGFHFIYLEKPGMAIIFWLTLGGFGIWWLSGVFGSKQMVADYNEMLAIKLFKLIVE